MLEKYCHVKISSYFCSRKQRGKDYEQKRQEHEKTAAFYKGGEPQNGQGRF